VRTAAQGAYPDQNLPNSAEGFEPLSPYGDTLEKKDMKLIGMPTITSAIKQGA